MSEDPEFISKKSSREAIQPQKTSATLKSWKRAVIILDECFGKWKCAAEVTCEYSGSIRNLAFLSAEPDWWQALCPSLMIF